MRTDDAEPDFQRDLKFGKRWEHFASQRLRELLPHFSMDNVSYERRPELQRAGIDTIFSQQNPTIDPKTQRHRYAESDNIPIEVMSSEEDMTPGWFYTSECDVFVWVFPNKPGTNLYHRGYFMPNTEELTQWVNERLTDWLRVRVDNGDWTTVVRLAPKNEFPPEFLVEFDPRLPTDRETPQSDLTRWTAGDGST